MAFGGCDDLHRVASWIVPAPQKTASWQRRSTPMSAQKNMALARRLIIEDQVAGADKVVTRFMVYAIHDLGELMGVAPSGRQMTNRAIVIHRIVEGKIAEEWGMGTLGAKLRGQRLEQEIRERQRVEQELQVARRIQQASLPKEVPTLESWQITPYYQPARDVGGDFYDFFDLGESRIGVSVGDATGKGVPAAIAASASR